MTTSIQPSANETLTGYALPAGGYRFPLIPINTCPTGKDKILALRLNSLASLFYFTKYALRRFRLTETLHLPLCSFLERDHIKDLIEFPRDFFKTTIATEGRPMWRALPFTKRDEDEFTKRGAPSEFVEFMRRQHQPTRRSLLVSENLTNAVKLGKRIRFHFESNAIYRAAFPETLPTASCKWSDYSLCVNRTQFGGSGGIAAAHGEGTFDFLGVGGALQSRHYDDITEDDLFGRKAAESVAVADDTIEYHRLVPGAFDQVDALHENDELVIGNRWGFSDLNSWIRENEPWFNITSHSALGGCCVLHPADTPIFPEEYPVEKLLRLQKRFGSYLFSCQFLNNPCSPENADFRPEWLNHFKLIRDASLNNGRWTVRHEVKDGIVRKDLLAGHMQIAMAVDPNHSGNQAAGRCRHAIVIVGRSNDDFYLLDAWAGHTSYAAFVGKIFEYLDKWHLRKFGLETVAAQKYLKFHIDQLSASKGRRIEIIELKGEVELPDGTMSRRKEWRIRNTLEPIFEFEHFFMQRHQQDFLGEYSTFPKGKFCDLLDALAYVPQMLRHGQSHARSALLLQHASARAAQVGKPYSVAVQ